MISSVQNPTIKALLKLKQRNIARKNGRFW